MEKHRVHLGWIDALWPRYTDYRHDLQSPSAPHDDDDEIARQLRLLRTSPAPDVGHPVLATLCLGLGIALGVFGTNRRPEASATSETSTPATPRAKTLALPKAAGRPQDEIGMRSRVSPGALAEHDRFFSEWARPTPAPLQARVLAAGSGRGRLYPASAATVRASRD